MVDDDLVLVHEDPKECEQIQSLKKIQLKEWSMVVTETLPPMMIAPSSHQSTMKISQFLNKMNNTHYHLHHLHCHRRLHLHYHHHRTHFRVILAVRFHYLGPTTNSAAVRFPGEASRRGGLGMDEDGEAGKALSWFPHLNFLNWKSFFFLNLIKLMFIYLFILKFMTWILF